MDTSQTKLTVTYRAFNSGTLDNRWGGKGLMMMLTSYYLLPEGRLTEVAHSGILIREIAAARMLPCAGDLRKLER